MPSYNNHYFQLQSLFSPTLIGSEPQVQLVRQVRSSPDHCVQKKVLSPELSIT